MKTLTIRTGQTLLLAVVLATSTGLQALAHGSEHDHGATTGGHDHSQHSHSRILKLGADWEAGLDMTDWSKPVRACPAHPQIISNRIGSNCPITSALRIDKPVAKPVHAGKRLGLVLLPAKGHKHPIGDARIQVRWSGQPAQALTQKDGYYWIDLPATARSPLTLEVQQGGKRQQVTVDS
jgi:hypothetical protein